MHRLLGSMLAVFAAFLSGSRTVAQEPAPSGEALAAGARTARVVIDPFPVKVGRGDSVIARFTLLDSAGAEVVGARWSLVTEGGGVRYRPAEAGASPSAFVFGGDQPGSQLFLVVVQVPGEAGRATTRQLDSLPVTVAEWPVARIEIADLEYAPYSGTTFRLKVKVTTAQGSEIEDPRVTWRTDDPCYARVQPGGVITFGAASKVTVTARTEGVSVKKEIRITTNPVTSVSITPKSAQTRVGDVVRFRVYAEDRRGQAVDNVALSYAVRSVDSVGGQIDKDGFFVADRAGTYVVHVSAGAANEEAVVEVAPRPPATAVKVTGRGPSKGVTASGLAVFTGKDGRDYAYVGTAGGTGRVYAWDVTDPARPSLSDSLVLDGGEITDLEVSGDASWAVVGRRAAAPGRNGVTVLDLASPGHPQVTGHIADSVAGGVNALWVSGNWVYAASAGNGALEILDLSDARQPRYAGRWEIGPGERRELFDVSGDQKYLYLAHGGDGLVIVDVGEDGSATAPKLVSRLSWRRAAARSVHRAGRHVYVADEVRDCALCVNGPRGYVRAIDVSRLKEPREVGRYEVPEAGAGRVWVDNSVLYVGYRQGGLRLVDVTGELRGDLYRQGRQVGWFMTDTPTMVLTALPFKGQVFVIDANSGLWVLAHQRAARLTQ
ncbi:MAG: hypothetical protein HY560_00140 [Gemmatimonadetes bacterium]|nr:hypothetical protein [Gemmatimonadota bacterium]